MKLKSLEICGFKSFPDRISLQFDEGITAVVGPNGSGKSNIADAVRWVLGEQSGKTLRSGKMEDVIFTGTHQRRAMGYACVTLYVDNSDRTLGIESDEVAVTRRIDRSGESEYRINGAAVRLRDVNELFMDTGLGRDGYSIIGQGRIAEIVGAKSVQRREIFEEAAGISKYRYRREQAERQLAQAQENLVRLRDILQELEDRVEPLREQAAKAKEYLQYAERRRALEVSLWMLSTEKAREQIRTQEDRLILAQNEREELQRALAEAEREIQSAYDRTAACNIETERLRGEMERLASEAAALREERAVLQNDITHNEEQIRRSEEDAVSQQAGRECLEAQMHEYALRMEEQEAALGELSVREAALTAQVAELFGERDVLAAERDIREKERTAIEKSLTEERMRGASSSAMIEQMRLHADSLDEEARRQADAAAGLLRQIKEVDEQFRSLEEQIVSQKNMLAGYALKVRAAAEEVREKEKELEGIRSRQKEHRQKAGLLREMEKNLDGFQQSVRFILAGQRSGNLRGIEGPVSRLIEVDAPYAAAVETALGGALQNIVVTTDTAAKLAIEALGRQKAGRATFLPISVIHGRTLEEKNLKKCEGFVAIASDLVRTQEKYGDIVRNLLGRIVVARDMDSALQIAREYRHRFKIVTLDGQVIHPGGSMTGGSLAKGTGLLSRAGEIARLERLAGELECQAEEKKGALRQAEAGQAALQAQMAGLEAEVRTMSEERIRCEGERKRLHMAREEVEARRKADEDRMLETKVSLQKLQEQSGSSEEAIRELSDRESAAAGALAAIKDKLEALAARISEQREAASALEMERLGLEKDEQSIRQSAEQLREQMESQNRQADEIRAQTAALRQANEEIREKILDREQRLEEGDRQRGGYVAEVERLAQEKTALERQSSEARGRERELHGRAETLAREITRLEERRTAVQAEYDAVIARLYDEYELTLTQAAACRMEIADVREAERELAGIKGKIKALGNVNLSAVDEFRQVNERYQFMRTQTEDAEHSREELYRLIDELTTEMRTLFLTNFQQIDTHFGRIFAELFGGGSARLLLDNPDDPLESGIEIDVQPPGKIIRNLAALSGGEQAFVAIAIYFAILKVHPSPFCLLDEIEAALDDVNVLKYAQYLRRLTRHTQFIAITHRRGTMEEADVLYGVTMQEEGVSKLLRMGVSELENGVGIQPAMRKE